MLSVSVEFGDGIATAADGGLSAVLTVPFVGEDSARKLAAVGVELPGRPLLNSEEPSPLPRIAVAVVVALIAAAIVLKGRGLEDRRRQRLDSLAGCNISEGPVLVGDGVRFLVNATGVKERFLKCVPT